MILRGITSIKIGDPAAGNAMGETLAALGTTYKDSVVMTWPEATKTEHFCEENDNPIAVIKDYPPKTLEWEITDFAPATLEKIFGGTVTVGPPANWAAPAQTPDVEKSIEILDKNSNKIEIPYADIVASVDANLSKTDVARIKITATVMAPDTASPFEITEAAS